MAQTLNISEDTAQRIADMVVGCRVDRVAEITGATQNLFTVAGGHVLMTGFYGEIMVAIDTANVWDINYDATTVTDTVMGTDSEALNGFVAGRMFYLPVNAAGAITVTAECGACPIDIRAETILPPGHFDLTGTNALTAGQVRWSIWYVPLDPGAYVYAT